MCIGNDSVQEQWCLHANLWGWVLSARNQAFLIGKQAKRISTNLQQGLDNISTHPRMVAVKLYNCKL